MDATPEPADAVEQYRHAIDAALSAGEAEPGTDLVPSGADGAVQVKTKLAEARKQIAVARKDALAKQESARKAIEAKKRELDEMLRTMNAELAPLQEKLARLEEGIFAVNLYLGRDEEIIPVREGERAPGAEQIVLRQMVLYMDEESVISAADNGIDFRDINLFIDWLNASEQNIEQLIPEKKAIVAIKPRRVSKRSGYTDPFTAAAEDEANKRTFWLVRNGQSLWLTTTEFAVGTRVIPTTNEFTDLFVTRDRFTGEATRLQPGSEQWLKAEKHADATSRHYMKVALLLQGLVDRTKVFHPLPKPDVSFLDQADYDDGYIRLLADAELALTTGRQPFFEWLRERNSRLSDGMRIVGQFGFSSGYRPWTDKERGELSNSVPQGERPDDGVYQVKPGRAPFDFSFTFARRQGVFDRDTWTHREAKTKATARFSADDCFVIPVDTITADEIRDYLGARTERHAYAKMFPLLKAALTFKESEAAEEKPFRDALHAQLLLLDGSDTDIAAADSDDLIAWYKTANKWHRPLEPDDAKASRLILAEARRRRNDAGRDEQVSETINGVLRAEMPGRKVLAIARRTNDYVAMIEQPRRYPALASNVFVTLVTFTRTGKLREVREWSTMTMAGIARWSFLTRDDALDSWVYSPDKKVFLTDLIVDDVIESVRAQLPGVFDIRISEKSEAKTRPELTMSCWAKDDDGAARHTLYSGWSGGTFSVQAGRFKSPAGVSLLDKERPWKINYWGRLHTTHTVWSDPAVEQEAGKLLDAAEAKIQGQRERSDFIQRFVRSIEDGWIERWWAEKKARYLDDYGDDGLWEEHKKSMRHPRYPHSGKALMSVVRELVDAGTPPYGLTVSEAIVMAGAEGQDVAEELLELRFRGEDAS